MKKIYIYGASNTDGFDPRGMLKGKYGPEFRFPDVLQHQLGAGWQVLDDGLNGRKIPQDGFLMDYLLQKLKAALPLDYVAIMLGTNDVLSGREPDAVLITGAMEQLCLRIEAFLQEAASQARLLLVTPPPLDVMDDEGEDLGLVMAQLQRDYVALAARHHWLCADTRSWNLELSYDGIHLSEQGSRAMGMGLAEWLKSSAECKVQSAEQSATAK